jgi:hypothetical protein
MPAAATAAPDDLGLAVHRFRMARGAGAHTALAPALVRIPDGVALTAFAWQRALRDSNPRLRVRSPPVYPS